MSESAKLRFGPYLTPIVAVGTVVECEVRGLVRIVGLSQASIPWPTGVQNGQEDLVVYKGLARAIRQEHPLAVAKAFGVPLKTVEQWQAKCTGTRRRKKQTRTSLPLPWKREEDELLTQLSLAEVARVTGKTLTAVRKRRRLLGLPDGRLATTKALRAPSLNDQVALVRERFQVRFQQLRESLQVLEATCARTKAATAYWRAQQSWDQSITAS